MVMKKIYFLLLVLLMSVSVSAQINVGYYRVKNAATNYFMYVTDNTGSINIQATDAEMGAIQLYPDLNVAITNPASVIYFMQVNKLSSNEYYCNFSSQGVDVYGLINYMVHIYATGGHYQVYAESNGMSKYLDDENSDYVIPTPLGKFHQVGTKKTGLLRSWDIIPIDNATDNYVAIKPNFTIGGKHYAPYYAEYPFSLSQGMKAYVVNKIDAEKKVAVYTEIPAGQIIPGATPVLVECSSTDVANNKITLYAPGQGTKPAANLLKGVYYCNDFRTNYSKVCHTQYVAETMRVFGTTADGKIGFVNSTANLHVDDYITAGKKKADGKFYLNANTSYLPVPAGTPDELTLVSEEEYKAMITPAITPGDANADGKIDDSDLMLLVNHLVGNTSDKFNKLGADVDGDGKVGDSDLMKLVNKLLGN